MAYSEQMALEMMKSRLNRLQTKTPLDAYLKARLDAAAMSLEKKGIHLTEMVDDTLLLVDVAVWDYQNRDQAGGTPEWLRVKIRERWLHDDS